MAFRTVTCVHLSCDLCGYTYGEADDGPWHCADEESALKYAKQQGWSQLADGRVVCDDEQHAAILAADAIARIQTNEESL
jgi:hypothetical protein